VIKQKRFVYWGTFVFSTVLVALLLFGFDGPAVSAAGGGKATADGKATANGEATASGKATASAVAAQTKTAKKEKPSALEASAKKLAPILILIFVVAVVLSRLPKVEGINHSAAFRIRRVKNWLPLGLTYAFLYMGRYNLKVSKFAFEEMQNAAGGPMMDNEGFGIIFGVGTIVYGFSFLINGPLTDRLGGKFSILAGAGGAGVINLLMGLCAFTLLDKGPGSDFVAENFVVLYSVLYGANMYFQSFGAVAIVKCNAPWFHVRERGVFGAIFGILISLGVYFAFDWGYLILGYAGLIWVFFVPAVLLIVFWVIDYVMVRNTPGEAGFEDFDTADASSGDDGPQLGAFEVFKRMLGNPIIITIALVEFCSGFLRQAIMQWYRTYAKQTNDLLSLKGSFIYENWGLMLCCAGIMGGVFAGVISDRVFQSRRGPVAAVLYGIMAVSALAMTFTYDSALVSYLVVFMSMAIIGVHGMLSGTASMDFGGRKNVGVAVGIIDGFVYLGTAVMSFTYAIVLPHEKLSSDGKLIGEATQPVNWQPWPISMLLVAILGLALATRVWNAKPKPRVIAK
jgi:OPA family glycerol-3-phosphate transporter-like MFS transporter